MIVSCKSCKDCGKGIDKPKGSRKVRCVKCRIANTAKYYREYYEQNKAKYLEQSRENRRKVASTVTRNEKKVIDGRKSKIEQVTLLKAHTQNTGPRGFAALVNKLIRGEK